MFAIVLVGYLYARRHLPDMAAANHLNMEVFTQALIFSVLSAKDFDISLYDQLALGALFVMLGNLGSIISIPLVLLLIL